MKFRKKSQEKELKKKRAYELLRENKEPIDSHHLVIREIIKEREVALVNCRYCGSQMESTVLQCPHCGARRK